MTSTLLLAASLELVLWHLISEWGVKALNTRWRDILNESLGGFEERQTVR